MIDKALFSLEPYIYLTTKLLKKRVKGIVFFVWNNKAEHKWGIMKVKKEEEK